LKRESLAYNLVTMLLRVLLLAALVFAVWNIYRKLPRGGIEASGKAAGETALQIVLRPSHRDENAAVNIPIQLYPVDVWAVQREFDSERLPGKRFDDFLKERIRMQGRAPVNARLDERGQVTVVVGHGKWWLYAILSGARNAEWRLPLNISGRQQIVVLSADNMYTRTGRY